MSAGAESVHPPARFAIEPLSVPLRLTQVGPASPVGPAVIEFDATLELLQPRAWADRV